MIPLLPNQIEELLIRDSNSALKRICKRYAINGFAYVFEVGQAEPCFYLAINTVEHGAADPSTGEWDFPAGGFIGDEMSDEWDVCYNKLDEYMVQEEESEDRLREVQAIFCSAMKSIRKQWIKDLAECAFTVNECNDTDDLVCQIYAEINEFSARPGPGNLE